MSMFLVVELQAPNGVSGKWYGVQDSEGNIVFKTNQKVKADDKAKILSRESEETQYCRYCDSQPAFANTDYCLHCGAQDSCWNLKCVCGNDKLWINDDELSYQCPTCDATSDKYIITDFDSAWIINTIFKRPDLHKDRSWIPASFVETLIRYVDSQPQLPQEYRCTVCGETSYSSTECANACGFGDTMELIEDSSA